MSTPPATLPPWLGHRVCLIGSSNAGKSSFSCRLGAAMGIEPTHLDQLAHLPHTNWQRRPNDEFQALHDAVVAREEWIIEGNYRFLMPQRLARASTVLWLDPPRLGCLYRYLRRCLRGDPARPGIIEGATAEFSWGLVRHLFFVYPRNCLLYGDLLREATCPVLHLHRMRELDKLRRQWGI